MVPEYYKREGFTSIEFVDLVLEYLDSAVRLTPLESYSVKDALKYAIRAGKKDPWEKDAYKCADYLCRAMFGHFMDEGEDDGSKADQD